MFKEEKVFKDPVHNYIHVQEELIWNLINTPEFQRLRRIRQLGTSFLTFHGAEHSRFSHSLGVYEITRRILIQFERNKYIDWSKEEQLLCLSAALLHDIGHGPFSHSLEQTFGEDHEEWTCKIILGDTEIYRQLRTISKDFPKKVVAMIQKKYEKPVLTSLITSALDADRMDYLLRDAYYTGVNYGTFDLDRILRMLRPYQDYIVVKESGKHAVEHYLMSRYQMYWQVYFHPVTRSSEIVLRQIFQRTKELFQAQYSFSFLIEPLSSLFKGTLKVREFLMLDESFMQTMFMKWQDEKDPILSNLCQRFLERRLYKYHVAEEGEVRSLPEIKAALEKAGMNPQYDLTVDFPTDLPYDVYRPGKTDFKQIFLLDANEQLIEISEASEIVRSISGIQKGRHYFYYPPEKKETIKEIIMKVGQTLC